MSIQRPIPCQTETEAFYQRSLMILVHDCRTLVSTSKMSDRRWHHAGCNNGLRKKGRRKKRILIQVNSVHDGTNSTGKALMRSTLLSEASKQKQKGCPLNFLPSAVQISWTIPVWKFRPNANTTAACRL